jgi:hypothetical protein
MHEPAAGGGFEARDVSLRPVLWVVVALLGALVGTVLLMSGLLTRLDRAEATASPKASPLAGYGPQTPPEPRLQTDPAGDLRQLRERERSQLTEYGWVDRERGVVRVPIERAMDLLAKQRGAGAP